MHDLGSVKVDEQTHSILKATAMSRNMDVTALARELLDQWAIKQLHVFNVFHALQESKGLTGKRND